MENLTAYRSPPPYPHSAQMLVHRSARSSRECGLRVGGYHREAEKKINTGGKRWHWKPHPYHRRSRCIILHERVWSNYKTMTPEPFTDVPQDCFHLFAFLLEQTTFPAESHWNEMLKSCHTRCGSPSDPISISLRSLYLFIFCHSVFSNLIGYFNAFLPFLFSVLSSLHFFFPPMTSSPGFWMGKQTRHFLFPGFWHGFLSLSTCSIFLCLCTEWLLFNPESAPVPTCLALNPHCSWTRDHRMSVPEPNGHFWDLELNQLSHTTEISRGPSSALSTEPSGTSHKLYCL